MDKSGVLNYTEALGYLRGFMRGATVGEDRERTTRKAPESLVVKQFPAAFEKSGTGERRRTMKITTAGVDRDQDTIAIEGWKLDNYLKNPVVLWQHQRSALPIGKTVELIRTADGLSAEFDFAPASANPLAQQIMDLADGGFISAASVGFLPTKWDWAPKDSGREYGIDFVEQELLEWSLVTVPSNPEALMQREAPAPVKSCATRSVRDVRIALAGIR